MGVFTELKREAFEANVALPRHGLINLTFGNASAIDRARAVFAIKPSGVGYEALNADEPAPLPRVSGGRRRCAHALVACDRVRPGRPADSDLRHDPCGLLQWRS